MSNNTSFVPGPDAEFSVFANGFATTLAANPSAYKLSPEAVTELQNKVSAWDTSFTALHQKRDAAKAATSEKVLRREGAEELIRTLAKLIQADPEIPEPLKVDAGLPEHSKTRTPSTAPVSAPASEIEACNVMRHSIRFIDTDNTLSGARPKGVLGIEIYRFVGNEAPVSYEQYSMYGIVTRMRARVDFTQDDIGMYAYYRFRYVNRVGEVGPWSMPTEAMVTG